LSSRRYETLDALRGVAALAVVGFHLGQVKLEPAIVPYGFLAVDFFFVLSGFVVAHAYENRLRDGLSWQAFFIRRSIRIYPLALLGAVMGLVVLLLKWHSFPSKVDPLPEILASGVLNSLILPTGFGTAASRHELFPGNGPLWTLFFEMVANAVWAAVGFRSRTRMLVIFTVACGVALAGLDCYFHTANIGFDVDTLWGGFARVGFGFSLGVLLFRFLPVVKIPSFRAGPPILAMMLIGVLAFPLAPVPRGIPWYPMVCTFTILPMIVVLGIGQDARGAFGTFVGNLSYPVYVLHFPIVLMVSGLHQSLLAGVNAHLLSAATVVFIIALGMAAATLYDEPIRRRLIRIVSPDPATPPQAMSAKRSS
jgi:peptidoglycan/LPS O-acetylase OafA/YrhL